MGWIRDGDAAIRSGILRGVFEANHEGAGSRGAKGSGGRARGKMAAGLLGPMAFVLFLCAPSDQASTFVHAGPVQSIPPRSAVAEPAPVPSPQFSQPGGEILAGYRFLLGRWEEPLPALTSQFGDPGEGSTSDYGLLWSRPDLRLSALFGLAVQTIVIDPGHGGRDPGAIGQDGTKEKDITLDVALRLRDRLTQGGKYQIVMTRESDTTLSLSGRVELANSVGPDLFVSIHVNALARRELNAIETYYFGPPVDDETIRLAERENKDSDYNFEAFREIVTKISDTVKRQESISLASSIQRRLYVGRKTHDRKILDWGTRPAPFVVLLGVDAPAVLAEISCISNRHEEMKLNLPEYREQVASYLEEGIRFYLDQRQLQAKGGEAHGQEVAR